jgi:hypothetical protein
MEKETIIDYQLVMVFFFFVLPTFCPHDLKLSYLCSAKQHKQQNNDKKGRNPKGKGNEGFVS